VPVLVERDLQPAGELALLRIATSGPRRPDADEIDRAVADIVIAVAAEILRRKFPIARDQPFLDAAQQFDPAVAAVPAVQNQIEVAREIAEVFGKGRSRRVPGCPDRPLVVGQPPHLDETPLRTVETRMIRFAEIRQADELAVGAVAPAVIGAGKRGALRSS
jgi:hypothetical protein